MRNWIVISLIVIVLICGITINNTSIKLVSEATDLYINIPETLLDDLLYVQDYKITSEGTSLPEVPLIDIYFSHEDFFYGYTINISIKASDPEAIIYYTTDGSNPTADSEIYIHPIELIAEDTINCTVIKAIAINNASNSSILTHSYFVGLDIADRFSTYVFSISSEADGLYGQNGILVAGNVEQNADNQANYFQRGIEWERMAYVEAFTEKGERIISQNSGIRVHGTSSRAASQKSLRIIARQRYETGVGKFHYDFFYNHPTTVNKYDTLILRNTRGDSTKLRDPLVSWIAYEAGYLMGSPASAAVVFINGEYYGYTILMGRFNEQYLNDLYKAPQQSFEILDGGNYGLPDIADEKTKKDFYRLVRFTESYGFLSISMTRLLHDFFDVDNLLFYYAIQLYAANNDWPDNNIKIWRYTGTMNANGLANELDGRWRFILNDLDATLYSGRRNPPNAKKITEHLNSGRNPILKAMLKKSKFAEIFANYICDLAGEHFSIQNVNRILNILDDMNLKEQMVRRDSDELLEYREPLNYFIAHRADYILDELRELFGYTEMYCIISDGTAKINSLNGYEGRYFIENTVPVTPVLKRGQAFDYWLVNGEKRYNEDLRISVKDTDCEGVVFVNLITRDKTSAEMLPLVFSDTYDNDDLFGFTMLNPNNITLNMRGYYLSDDIDNLKRWAFPSLNVRQQNTLEFVGRNATSYDSLLKIGLNFNPRQGEIIYLSNENGDILDYIEMRNSW